MMPCCWINDRNIFFAELALAKELMTERDTGGATTYDGNLVVLGCGYHRRNSRKMSTSFDVLCPYG